MQSRDLFLHIKGFNGALPGSVKAHPAVHGRLFFIGGAGSVVAGQENNLASQVVLQGHDDRVTAMTVSYNGALVASGQRGKNADVIIWDTARMANIFRFQEHDHEVVQLAYSPDDRLLLTIGSERDQKLYILDTATNKIVTRFVLDPKRVTAAAWGSSTGNIYTFATASKDEVIIWVLDPHTGMLSKQQVNPGSIRREFTSLLWSTDGAWLYAGTGSADVVAINVVRKAMQTTHPICGAGVGALLATRNGILVGGKDGALIYFDPLVHWRDIKPFTSVQGCITSLSLTAGGDALIVGVAQGIIYRVELGTNSIRVLSQAHTAGITGISFASNDRSCVATSSIDGSVCVWSMQDYSLITRIFQAVDGGATSVGLTPTLVISGWADGAIRAHVRGPPGAPVTEAWALPHAHKHAHSCGVTALQVSNRGAFFASGGAGGEIRIWDMANREMVNQLKLHQAAITDLSVLADDAHVACSSDDRSWSIFDIHQCKARASWRGISQLKGVAVSPDKVSVVTVSQDRRIQAWDVRVPDAVRSIGEAHEGEIGCVAFDWSGRVFATGGADHKVKLWDFQEWRLLEVLDVHTGPVTKIVFSPDNQRIISVGLDGAMIVHQHNY